MSGLPKRNHLVCITKNGTNPAYEGARVGARRIAESAGYSLTSLFPATPDDPVEQEALIAQAMAESPSALLIAPAHPTRLEPAIAEVQSAGVPVISFVSRTQNLEPECFVTSDNFSLAKGIAAHLFEAIGGTGRVAIIEGNPDSETSAPRTEGFLYAIAQEPGIELIATETGFYQRDPAALAMTQILEREPHLDGVLVANDFMALGVINSLRAAERSAAVVSVNAMPEAIGALKSGALLATSAFDAMKIACAATLAAIRIVEGEPVPRFIELPVEIVTAENCAAWDKAYEDRPLLKWRDLFGQ